MAALVKGRGAKRNVGTQHYQSHAVMQHDCLLALPVVVLVLSNLPSNRVSTF